ncbi:MAG: hypothetical protein EXQ49_05025 [Acidobacteria bacterium]|nr:hypothetical protein [Acidobacteriota bacterium]
MSTTDPVKPGLAPATACSASTTTKSAAAGSRSHGAEYMAGRVSDAAKLLGISRKGLFLKRKKLGME